jgi:hypothetical protein
MAAEAQTSAATDRITMRICALLLSTAPWCNTKVEHVVPWWLQSVKATGYPRHQRRDPEIIHMPFDVANGALEVGVIDAGDLF